MKNRPVSISASEALNTFVMKRARLYTDFAPSPLYRNVLIRAIHNIEEFVNLKRLEFEEDFDSLQFAREELGHLFGVSSSMFDGITLEDG